MLLVGSTSTWAISSLPTASPSLNGETTDTRFVKTALFTGVAAVGLAFAAMLRFARRGQLRVAAFSLRSCTQGRRRVSDCCAS
jgi:hypothetical protein